MTSAFAHHAVILIRAEDRVAANLAVLAVDPEAGDTFEETRGASPTGAAPPTHLYAGMQMRPKHFQLCQEVAAAQFPGAVVLDATAETAAAVLDAELAARGLVRVEGEMNV